jgi:AraC-like DNA-binding protein
MIYRTHVPAYPLGQFIEWLWFYEGFYPDHDKERVLPEGSLELVIDLQAGPKRLFDRADHGRYQSYRRGWISGAHSEYIVIQATANSSMMGIHFRPGGAYPFFGFPITELQDAVVELEAIWGGEFVRLRDELIELPDAVAKLHRLESFLIRRMRKAGQLARTVEFALKQFSRAPQEATVCQVAERLGVSHKHLIQEFAAWVGLTPKLYCRVRRFQAVLGEMRRRKSITWADLAFSCGYYDQAHFIKEFQSFCGLTPTRFRQQCGDSSNFIPIRDSSS